MQNINQDIALAIFNSTDRPSQSRNIISLREKVEAYSKQRVIEELEEQMELAEIGNSYTRLRERVQELKQDQDEK
jgi:hypothetical protein